MSAIAMIGMACRYADARSPEELWENVLARRRAFRRIPAERLLLNDYFASDPAAPDAIYAAQAALIEGYEFDRARFRVGGPAFRSVDMTHWLALDVAAEALTHAGFADGEDLPRETAGVLVGNTLTGEFSRAATLRLRWPYVRRVVEAGLRGQGWDQPRRNDFLRSLEEEYKSPFAPVGEETLAGALSNTIAGRICNHFHLGGGGYTLDGACCSSLLAVARACSALESGEIDVALAGGVDLSLDPFELVGFAKAGALAHGEMRVYDRESTGFLPGEGCGFVVLMRESDARTRGHNLLAVIRGWGISSDGSGSITRPEVRGQVLALERAYRRAGYGTETVELFEGHGTGTPVGDEVELQALTAVRRSAGARISPAAIGSIKANIGHTKAAAGVAGLIKAALAVHHQTLPPATGVFEPRPELRGDDAVLRIADDAELWPRNQPLRAGVNSFGFGGINVHVTLEGPERERVAALSSHAQLLSSSAQDAELFLFAADSSLELAGKLHRVAEKAPGLSCSELSDASAVLAATLGSGRWRAAIVASSPEQLTERLHTARELLAKEKEIADDRARHLDPKQGIFVGLAAVSPRIGLLFPGQASPVRLDGGAHARRFGSVRELHRDICWPTDKDTSSTHTAQVAIAIAEIAGLRMLSLIGVEGSIAVGHSLGELAAYCWAGALDERRLLGLVDARGLAMAGLSGPAGAMASISASREEVATLLEEEDPSVVIACLNASQQTVVAGETDAVARVLARVMEFGWSATRLPAAHGFHSPLMLPAVEPFRKTLSEIALRPLARRVVSTITGTELAARANLRDLMAEQLTAPVRFTESIAEAREQADLWIEVGPGQVLTHLAASAGATPAVALDVGGSSLAGLLAAAAAGHVAGARLRTEELFQQRFTRAFDFDRVPRFFVNPCELAPAAEDGAQPRTKEAQPVQRTAIAEASNGSGHTPIVLQESGSQIVRALVARRTELPADSIAENAHLLRDLHLSSIMVGEIVAAAARSMGIAPPRQLLEFADVTVGQAGKALERLRANASGGPASREAGFAGVDDWQRAFFTDWQPRPLRRRPGTSQAPGVWRVFAPHQPQLGEAISQAALPGSGVIVCLPLADAAALEEQAESLLQSAGAALEAHGRRHFVVLGQAAMAAAFARTLHLEHPEILTRVIEAPADSRLIDNIRDEVMAAGECIEARYQGGERSQLCWRLFDDRKAEETPISLHAGDVVLISGGGKGITAECSMMLAVETGAALAILGRTNPKADPGLSAHLDKLAALGIRAKYFVADVTDAGSVRKAVRQSEETLGTVTAIVHGAGRNQPRLLRDLDRETLRLTLAPKVQGLRNLLGAVDCTRLRMLVTFGSVIGRAGLRGEAEYALANACQSRLTEDFAREHRACCCLAFESSAWSGTGMAERLGTLETLRGAGVSPIPTAQGVSWLRRLLSRRLPATSIVLTGRLGLKPPVTIAGPSLPLLRFLEKPQVFYPGVELVADVEITAASDPYLMDHVFESQPLLPGVMALEAMTQAALALTGETQTPVLSRVHFDRPLVVEPGSRVTLRVAALLREPGVVEVVMRSSQTEFQVDHFRGICDFREPPLPAEDRKTLLVSRLALDPEKDLYGRLLFQSGRFRRLAGYRSLNARSCCAEIAANARSGVANGSSATLSWFGQYLPGRLLLGDPGGRDAALHAVQACVPHAVLLPVAVKRVRAGVLNPSEELLVFARRRWREGKIYCYDVDLRTKDGTLRERWEELELRQVAEANAGDWPDPLVAAYLEWRVEEAIAGSGVAAAFDRDRGPDRRMRSERAIQKALNSSTPVRWRADGKPEVELGAVGVSAAHANGLTLAVAGPSPVACDLEPVCTRSEDVWRDLLGREHWNLAEVIAGEAREDLQTAATRVWTALESLKKAEAPGTPLVLVDCSGAKQGCVAMAASGFRIASSIVRFRDDPTPFAVSVLARSEEWATTNTGTA